MSQCLYPAPESATRKEGHTQFAAHGVDLFVEVLDRIVNASREGQVEMADLIRVHLQRIDRDSHGVPIRLYPFTRKQAEKEAIKSVVMDPRVAFGRPVLIGTAVPTTVLADRFKAGDTLTDLGKDYGAQPEAIEEAIRCELPMSSGLLLLPSPVGWSSCVISAFVTGN